MAAPQAVRKHDGRTVAFDLARLARSILHAALDAGLPAPDAPPLSGEMARAAAEFLTRDYPAPPSTADLRELVAKLLRETGQPRVADAYSEHARRSAALLWSLRLTDGGPGEGAPWDRRRLMESLRASGVARDPAGEIAREIERQLVQLGQDRISSGLVHALTVLQVHRRGLDARRYTARRVAVSFSDHVPRHDAAAAAHAPLPQSGPALSAFWLQCVHSGEVTLAVSQNQLALDPFPAKPESDVREPAADAFSDPLQPDAPELLNEWASHPQQVLRLRADDPSRLNVLARWLAGMASLPESARNRSGSWGDIRLAFAAPAGAAVRERPRVSPVTLNVAGTLAREGLRETARATPRLARMVAVAAHAHREREEYWGYSPVRGRELPIAVAGLWNAAAWLHGLPFERPGPGMSVRLLAGTLVSILHGAVLTLRQETGVNLILCSDGPSEAGTVLWRRDREYFARDGLNLDPAGEYGVGLELRVAAGVPELSERLDFLRSVALLFDEPPAMRVEAPLGQETDETIWREWLQALAQTGVPRARLVAGGSGRSLRLLSRLVRSHLEGYPLFERSE
jgi:hypothetical protein